MAHFFPHGEPAPALGTFGMQNEKKHGLKRFSENKRLSEKRHIWPNFTGSGGLAQRRAQGATDKIRAYRRISATGSK